ncbi:hypothetical protein ABVT39_024823 [Epinephelus coioides]
MTKVAFTPVTARLIIYHFKQESLTLTASQQPLLQPLWTSRHSVEGPRRNKPVQAPCVRAAHFDITAKTPHSSTGRGSAAMQAVRSKSEEEGEKKEKKQHGFVFSHFPDNLLPETMGWETVAHGLVTPSDAITSPKSSPAVTRCYQFDPQRDLQDSTVCARA